MRTKKTKSLCIGAMALCMLCSPNLVGQSTKKMDPSKMQLPTAEQSDPNNFGWMRGFPPAPAKRLRVEDGSFYKFPATRHTFVHMREFVKTVPVKRQNEVPVHKFEYALDPNIADVKFTPLGGTEQMTWRESLAKNYADGIIILHKGKVVFEEYYGALKADEVHALMSCTKSLTAVVATTLAAEGKFDLNKQITHYVPELKGSAYDGATVQQVLDMTASLNFNENYLDPKADIYVYNIAGGLLPPPPGYQGPVGYFDYLKTLKKGPLAHGEQFAYKTVNTDALAWAVSRATGKRMDELFTEMIWSKLGMEQDACFQVDAVAIPFAGGGLCTSLRDLARFGEMIRCEGKWNGKQVIPASVVKTIVKGGDKAKFAPAGYKTLPGWSYKNMWWVSNNEHQAYTARGVHGQTIYVDPKAEMVIVRFGSNPMPGNPMNDHVSLPAYHSIAKYLLTK